MSTDFSRMLTLLRKERGISQKQAAEELHVSQALLSHYEKGIRECGLQFVVRTADFYQVSCDYLLGRSPHRTGTILQCDDLASPDPSLDKQLRKGGVMATLNKKLIVNSLDIVFDLLQKVGDKTLTTEVSTYFMLGVYHIFRMLYQIHPKNELSLFEIAPETCSQLALAASLRCDAAMAAAITSLLKNKKSPLNFEDLHISTDTLEQEYQQLHTSLLQLLKTVEQNIQQINP